MHPSWSPFIFAQHIVRKMPIGAFLYTAVLLLVIVAALAYAGEEKFKALESFVGLSDWMPTASGRRPDAVPEPAPEPLQGALKSAATEKLLASDRLQPMAAEEAGAAWGKFTSERCYRSDMGEVLKPTGNFLQRTNNYPRSHPDSCSAPNHEFIGTFYRPHEGVGATPATGLPLPKGALAPLGC
jgi:hypothetical protein